MCSAGLQSTILTLFIHKAIQIFQAILTAHQSLRIINSKLMWDIITLFATGWIAFVSKHKFQGVLVLIINAKMSLSEP